MKNKLKIMKWYIKLLLTAFVSMFVFLSVDTLLIGTITEFREDDRVEWEAVGSPYNYKDEHLRERYWVGTRIMLADAGLNPDGIILRMLATGHKNLYMRAKAKIPESDIAWIRFWARYELFSLIYCTESEATISSINTILDALRNLAEGESKVRAVDLEERYTIANTLIRITLYRKAFGYLMREDPEGAAAFLSYEEQLLKRMKEQEDRFFDSEIKKVTEHNETPFIPTDLTHNIMDSYSYYLAYHKELLCDSKEVKTLRQVGYEASVYYQRLQSTESAKAQKETFDRKAEKYAIIQNRVNTLLQIRCGVPVFSH